MHNSFLKIILVWFNTIVQLYYVNNSMNLILNLIIYLIIIINKIISSKYHLYSKYCAIVVLLKRLHIHSKIIVKMFTHSKQGICVLKTILKYFFFEFLFILFFCSSYYINNSYTAIPFLVLSILFPLDNILH